MDLSSVYSGRTVLVTGAGGFIGSHLTEALVDLGARVRVVDLALPADGGNLAACRDRVDFTARSLVDPAPLDGLVEGCDFVFHLAGNASAALAARDPALDFELNVVATHRLMEACRRAGTGPFVFASTATVYGEPERDPIDETHPLRPQSPYAGAKLACESLLAAHGRCYGRDHRILRLFSTFGPRQRAYVMFDLLEKLRRDPRHLEILGTGHQRRTYNFVTDAAHAFLWVGAHPDARGGLYNAGGEIVVSIRELADLVVAATGIAPPQVVCTGESWPGDIALLVGDSSRLRALGYRPVVGFADGLRRLVAWHRREYAPPW